MTPVALIDIANPRSRAAVGGTLVAALVFLGYVLLSDHSVVASLVTGIVVGAFFAALSLLMRRRGPQSQR
jgi:hypothetical protein